MTIPNDDYTTGPVVGKVEFGHGRSRTHKHSFDWCSTEKPYKCPVCGGRGKVERGFYDSYNKYPWQEQQTTGIVPYLNETCRTCSGSGVLRK